MIYIKIKEGHAPKVISVAQIRQYCEGTSLEFSLDLSFLSTLSIYRIIQAPKPAHNSITQNVKLDEIYQDDDGEWRRDWIVEDVDENSARIRAIAHRDALWTEHVKSISGVEFALLSEESAESIKTFAKELLDIVNSDGFPITNTWPTPPELLEIKLYD